MTTIDSTTRPAVLGDGAIGSFSAAVADWATSTDHKKIGRLFAGCGLVSLAGYAVLGLLLALERAAASETVLPENSLVQLFQAHRIGMIFDGLLPLTLGLAIAVVPMQLGARSIAFARLALTSFYLWLGGIVLIGISLIGNGGINGGNAQMVDLFLAGHGLMLLGLIAAAVSVATTVLTTRAPGMTMRRIPFLSWAALVQALGMLIALPVMFGMVVYLFIDLRNASLVFSGPDAIGDELGAFLTQPLTFVFALT
ncbi:MAG: cbb3-type cytochrome c oxidase subunit I, partial [Ilumatobacteraceae bacterium]